MKRTLLFILITAILGCSNSGTNPVDNPPPDVQKDEPKTIIGNWISYNPPTDGSHYETLEINDNGTLLNSYFNDSDDVLIMKSRFDYEYDDNVLTIVLIEVIYDPYDDAGDIGSSIVLNCILVDNIMELSTEDMTIIFEKVLPE